MILAVVNSINGIPIRLTEERWEHIVDRRPHMTSYLEATLTAVEHPTVILRGRRGRRGQTGQVYVAVLALGPDHYLHIAYREFKSQADGFIITATLEADFDARLVIWRAQEQ